MRKPRKPRQSVNGKREPRINLMKLLRRYMTSQLPMAIEFNDELETVVLRAGKPTAVNILICKNGEVYETSKDTRLKPAGVYKTTKMRRLMTKNYKRLIGMSPEEGETK